jgi:hypothetical protein
VAVASIVSEGGFPLPPERGLIATAQAAILNAIANREYTRTRFNIEDHG